MKFRKNVWIKRGDFVLVELIKEGDKVKAEIVRILSHEHIKEFKKAKVWPAKFSKKEEEKITATNSNDSENSDDDNEKLQGNPNRRHFVEDSESNSDEDTSDDED
jgi:probable RNA-binding protein EIF1AD